MNSANVESIDNTASAKPEKPAKDPRIVALRRFAISITVFNILGYTVLGFEPSWAAPLAALAVAYVLELGLETLDAWATRRPVKYAGGPVAFLNFLLPAHITALACSMLLYANSRLGPVVFAVIVGVASKYLIRVRIGGRLRHVLNPSNLGIAIVLVLFPWVGIAPPYHFTEWVGRPFDVAIPVFIVVAGTMLNAKLTKKMPLIFGWVGVFALQAVIRTVIDGRSTVSALLVMTGVAFVLFTNYMITDPATTPLRPRNQFVFGATTAVVYAVLVHLHVVYGLFFALVIVCALRGVILAIIAMRRPAAGRPASRPEPKLVRTPAPARGGMLAPTEEAK